jgi:hypothetical protein
MFAKATLLMGFETKLLIPIAFAVSFDINEL